MKKIQSLQRWYNLPKVTQLASDRVRFQYVQFVNLKFQLITAFFSNSRKWYFGWYFEDKGWTLYHSGDELVLPSLLSLTSCSNLILAFSRNNSKSQVLDVVLCNISEQVRSLQVGPIRTKNQRRTLTDTTDHQASLRQPWESKRLGLANPMCSTWINRVQRWLKVVT